MSGPEFQPKGAERTAETEKAAGERLKELAESGEQLGEKEDQVERVKEARLETEALFSKEQSAGENKAGGEPSGPSPTPHVTRKDREESYQMTMSHVREEMSPPSRVFSKIIHNPAVEKTSEVLGSTVARPNAILSGACTAFIAVGAVYLLARYYGYELSGFETIGAFAAGWLLGILFDFFRVMITGKR